MCGRNSQTHKDTEMRGNTFKVKLMWLWLRACCDFLMCGLEPLLRYSLYVLVCLCCRINVHHLVFFTLWVVDRTISSLKPNWHTPRHKLLVTIINKSVYSQSSHPCLSAANKDVLVQRKRDGDGLYQTRSAGLHQPVTCPDSCSYT